MKAEDHLKKANEIMGSIDVLKDDEQHVIAVVELSYGLAFHLIAYGLDRKFSEHRDTHSGLPAFLRKHGQSEVATSFERLDTLRHGRWYGGRGDGEVVREAMKIIDLIERWATG
jgi:hypothetical protein